MKEEHSNHIPIITNDHLLCLRESKTEPDGWTCLYWTSWKSYFKKHLPAGLKNRIRRNPNTTGYSFAAS